MIDLRDFVVQASRDGELSLDHLVDGCWGSVPFETDGSDGYWPNVQQLNEAATRHMSERHRVVIEGESEVRHISEEKFTLGAPRGT